MQEFSTTLQEREARERIRLRPGDVVEVRIEPRDKPEA